MIRRRGSADGLIDRQPSTLLKLGDIDDCVRELPRRFPWQVGDAVTGYRCWWLRFAPERLTVTPVKFD